MSHFDQLPPALCRLLAAKNRGRKPLSTRAIADKSGLSKSVVDKVSKLTTWDDVSVSTMLRFTQACGVDILHIKSTIRRIRRLQKPHLHAGQKSQEKMIIRLLEMLSNLDKR